MTTASPRFRIVPLAEGARVTPIELFLDLVFVFGFTQITELIAHENSAMGLLHGMVVLGLVWWLWAGYSWLGNMLRIDEGGVRIVLFAVMALVFIIDVTIPEAFHDIKGGLWGPWVFAVCFLLVQLTHVSLMVFASRQSAELRRNSLLLLIPAFGTFGLLMWAGSTSGVLQSVLWLAGLALYVGAVLVINAEGWQLTAASHFAERHGLIVIIALGESIVSIGVGVTALPVTWSIIVASVLGVAVLATLWWTYFDVTALIAEDVLHHASERERPRLARDAYSLLHLPMIAGIILFSFGLKKVFSHLSEPLELWGLVSLYGGVSLYLLALVGFRLRNIQSWNVLRCVTAALLMVLIPLLVHVHALVTLGVLAVIMAVQTFIETHLYSQLRERVRHGDMSARP